MNGVEEISAGREVLRVEKAVYGGDGLAHTPRGEVVFVPFVLPGERVERPGTGFGPGRETSKETGQVTDQPRVLTASPDRVAPRCIHFGRCGGCQYQMAAYPAQVELKRAILSETMQRAGLHDLPEVQTTLSPDPWGYRNRIRLRVREVEGELRLGYHVRGTEDFLPVSMCPIAAPLLWRGVESLLQVASEDREARDWLRAAREAELFCDGDESRLQVHLLCAGPVPTSKKTFERFAEALRGRVGNHVSLSASELHLPSGRTTRLLAASGPDGMPYRVGDETFWLSRGSFFQVNRFLLASLVSLVQGAHQGKLAWDLYAGAGLFSRALRVGFTQVTAVEANRSALQELQRGLRAGRDRAHSETVLQFLRRAPIQRERPELVVLDPPRAGAGEEACRLLVRLQPEVIVYVSCDPSTLARDAAVLLEGGYGVDQLHMVDLFPQTYHLETVMVFRRGNERH